MHTITRNTTTTFTVSPVPSITFASDDSDFFHIHSYGTPCPASRIGSNSLKLNADNWLGLVETATFPNTEIEMKQMNLTLGGSRNFSYQYKGIETASGGNIGLIANQGTWLYYALGRCTGIKCASTGGNTPQSLFLAESGTTDKVYIDTGGSSNTVSSAGSFMSAFTDQGPIFYRSREDMQLLPPTVYTQDLHTQLSELTVPTFTSAGVIQNPITYEFSEANGTDLPSFSLEHSIAKTSNVTSTQGTATETETFVRIARGNRVNTFTLTANENEEIKMTMDLNTRTVDYINDLTTTEVYTPRNNVGVDTTLLNYTSGTGANGGLEPFFFSSGLFSCFGQTFLKITNLTLTINNNLQDKRYVGVSSKAIKSAIPAQRTYEIAFTAIVTDDKLFQELLNNAEDLGSTNEIVLQFDKDSGEQILLNFQDYFLSTATLTVPDDKGPITVEGTVMPRTMSKCEVKTHWVLQG